jgi:phosphomethylpyrimidine synthase
VRISKEIVELDSGKAAGFQRERVMKSAALTPEQQAILEKRGNLPPEEIHKLASKTRGRMGASVGEKAACHSDHVEPEAAQELQGELVPLRRKPAEKAPPPAE